MIKITKSSKHPDEGKCNIATLKICEELENENKINISNAYKSEKIKIELKKTHHNKCCYCEKKILDNKYATDVEHFRPKSQYPWLAYEWSNLLLSCADCNRGKKIAMFPLKNETKKAKSPNCDLKNEEPIIIHPVFENPEDFIFFRKEVAHWKNTRGKQNITILGLNRSGLEELRRNKLAPLKFIDNKEYLDSLKLDEAEYAGMIRSNF